MAHIFISYHRSDIRFAEALEGQLREAEFQTWRDPDLRAGESWREGIDDAIREAAVMVLVMSPAAKGSAYVNYEWAFALGAGVKVIPLLLGLRPEELHPRLAHGQTLDFTDRAARRWDKLFVALNEPAGSRRPATPRGLPEVVEQAARALDSVVPAERAQAIDTLKQTDHPAASEVLAEKGLCHPVREVRLRAAVALASLKDPRAIPGLLEVIRIGAANRPEGVPWVSESDLAEIGPAAVPELIKALEDSDKAVRCSATRALGILRHDAALPGLAEQSRSEGFQTRRSALWILGEFGPHAPVQLIAERLSDENAEVRGSAVEALCKIGGPEAASALTGALGDTERDVRLHAAAALGEIGNRSAVPALVERLKNDPSAGVVESAAKALAKIGGPEAVRGLLEVLANPKFEYRTYAAAALGDLKDPMAVPGLIAVLRDQYRLLVLEAADALDRIGTPEAKAASAAARGRS